MYANLKLQIFKLGIHQNYLAKEVGIAESILSRIIHGYREPSPSERQALAAFLRVEEKWLFEKFDGPAQMVGATVEQGGHRKNGNL
jgi:transcriptional regulator with XRE-family HTH domain